MKAYVFILRRVLKVKFTKYRTCVRGRLDTRKARFLGQDRALFHSGVGTLYAKDIFGKLLKTGPSSLTSAWAFVSAVFVVALVCWCSCAESMDAMKLVNPISPYMVGGLAPTPPTPTPMGGSHPPPPMGSPPPPCGCGGGRGRDGN